MEYKPHAYQKAAIEFILSHPIAAVFLDMGLGKTVITLTAIAQLLFDRFEVSRVLVVAPLRVAQMTWSDEIRHWDHLKNLTWAVAVGSERERRAAVLRRADITMINRENLQWLVEKSGLPFDFDMVVLDELSSFKSWQSHRFKSFMKIRPCLTRVVGLTGTPSPNGLMDLFAEYRCLDMGERLGRFITRYRAAYFQAESMRGQIVYSYRPLPGAEEKIYSRIQDITISMRALDHLQMPDLIFNRYPVYMSREEKELYDRLKKNLLVEAPSAPLRSSSLAYSHESPTQWVSCESDEHRSERASLKPQGSETIQRLRGTQAPSALRAAPPEGALAAPPTPAYPSPLASPHSSSKAYSHESPTQWVSCESDEHRSERASLKPQESESIRRLGGTEGEVAPAGAGRGSLITAQNAASLSNKLSQMANGCVYDDDGWPTQIHDRKLDALEDIIEAAQGPVLVCYWYKHDLARIESRLRELEIPHTRIDTDESIRAWNAGQLSVGLIHPASAGHGLNLQSGGHAMVWFGLTWSLELYAQTVARLWRQGQKARTVVVQHIVTAGTIDERILKAIERKERTQDALLAAVKAELEV